MQNASMAPMRTDDGTRSLCSSYKSRGQSWLHSFALVRVLEAALVELPFGPTLLTRQPFVDVVFATRVRTELRPWQSLLADFARDRLRSCLRGPLLIGSVAPSRSLVRRDRAAFLARDSF